MKSENRVYYYIAVFATAFISFFLYSSNFYPLLSSDDALNILMAHYYKFPADIYCWGQDRGGTLIPLISQFFIKVFHFKALTSVSLSNYIILIAGYFCFSGLLRTNYTKLLFAIIWFLPFQRFIDLLRFPIAVEYSIIAAAIMLINRLDFKTQANEKINNILLSAISILLIISVWVSDLAIITIASLFIILAVYSYIERKTLAVNKIIYYYSFIGIMACFFLIRFAKKFASVKAEHYLSINNIHGVKSAILTIAAAFGKLITFSTNEIFAGIYLYLVILFLILFLFFILRRKLIPVLISDKWLAFFLLDFIAIFSTFLLATWVLANGMGRWYFVASYISFSMTILISIDLLAANGYQLKFFRFFLFAVVLIGAISPVYSMKYISPKTLRPKAAVVGEFRQLGKIGVIAEYWNSYITSCPDPEMIKATPNDKSDVKNQALVDMVFEQKNLYVIKDLWMDTFPDTLEQFGYVLVKNGNQFRLGDCNVCKYNKAKLLKIIPLHKFRYDQANTIFDPSVSRKVLFAGPDNNINKDSPVIYGPYIPLGIGEFTARFYMKANNFINDSAIARIDVTADWSNIQISEKELSKACFTDNKYHYIDLDFKTSKRNSNIEFRIFFYGNASLYFDHLELKEK